MDLAYITSNNWNELEKLHERAFYFLSRCALVNERKHLLTSEYILNDWQKSRLSELEQWHRDMVKIGELA